MIPEEDLRSTAAGGSSSPDGPDESLRNFLLGFFPFRGDGIETAVETGGFGGTSLPKETALGSSQPMTRAEEIWKKSREDQDCIGKRIRQSRGGRQWYQIGTSIQMTSLSQWAAQIK
jgi:hypothetical protein